MALKIGDRVRENTSSTGVGGLSLTGAPAGFQRFSAILSSGDTTYYSLEENDKFEIGIATYGSNNLERTTVLSSSNSGNKISLGGSGVVFITYPAAKAFFASEGDEFTVPSSGLVFSNGAVIKDAKLVELTDVNLSGTPVQNSVFDLNITNKSLSIGDLTGPTNSNNILIGYGAGSGITTGSDSVIIGAESSTINKTGQHNVHIGAKAGPVVSDAASSVYNSVAVGYSAGNKMRHESVAIGYEAALHAYEIGFIGIGYQVGSGLGSYSTVIGYQAGRTLGEDYAVALGYQAGYNGAGEASVWIGQGAGHSSTGSTRSIGIGKNAGKSSSGNECIYIGEGAGTSNSSNNLVFIGNSTPATNGSLVKGDMDAKRIAVGVADVTLDDTFFVGVNSANDEGIVVKAAVSQVSNLTSWKNSSGSVLASVSKDGVVSAHEIVATGNGIQIANLVPASTTNKLYNDAGSLYFNGSRLASAGSSSSIAQYASGQAVANQGNIVAVSGIAAYASGVGSSGGDVTTVQLNYVSGISVYGSGQTILNQNNITALLTASGTATSLIASSGVAAYASGQVISNQSNISTNTSRVAYASGQAIANKSDIATNTSSISSNTGNISSNTNKVNYASGQAIENESDITALLTASGTATSLIASSGIATYASGQAIANESDIATNTSSISTNNSNIVANTAKVNYASGQAVSNQSNISALLTASGTATSLISSSGIANYASGQAIENESLATYASGQVNIITDGTAEASKALVLDSSKSFTGVKDGRFSRFDSFVYSTGVSVGNSGVLLERNTPGVTTDTLYNVGGTLYFNGSQLASAGGASATAQYASGQATSLNTASGVATYASGQAIANESDIVATSGIANYASGLAITNELNVAYASGQAIANETDIATNVSNISTNTSNISTNTARVSYASGQAISNQGNITALLSASGTATSLIASSGIASYASGQAIANEGDLVAVSGIAAYASGVSLTVKEADNSPNVSNVRTIVVSNGTLTDNGGGQVTLTTGGGGGGGDVTTAQLNYVSGIAVYASGQSQSLNTVSGVATSLVASSGIATYASGQAIENEGIATYASGQAIENESDILAVSGIAAFSSGVVTDVDVIIGQVSTTAGTGIAIGYGAGLDSSIDKANALNGYKASDVLIGHFAGSGYIHHAPTSTALSSEQQNVMIGFKAGANSLNYRGGSTALGDNVYIGVEAGHTASGYHRVCIGDEAAHSSSGIRVVAIGAKCFEHSEGDDNTAVGYRAGGHSTGDHNLYLGILAGFGVIGANNIELLTEGPNPSLIGGNSNKIHIENTIIGDTSAKKIAIGNIAAGDLTPDATLEVKPKVASDIGIIVQAVSSHSASLQEWHNSSEAKLLAVGPDGGVELPNNVPSTTTNKLYNDGGTLKFNGSAVGGGGSVSGDTFATDLKIGRDSQNLIDFATTDNKVILRANNINQVSLIDNVFGPEADSDVDLGTTGVRWKDAYIDSITVTGEIDGDSLDIEGDADINGTTNLDAVDIDGNVQIDGTVTVGVDDTGKDVKFFGATSGSYFEWDESEDRLNLVGAAYVQEAVPANDTPTAEDATVTLDLKKGNYHNISLGQNVTKFEFTNAKRGQRFILRITQNGSSAKTVAWTNVDYTTGGAAATVRWAGNIVPTMSTSTSHTDVYGFLCTNNAGSAFDGFIVGQDLHD